MPTPISSSSSRPRDVCDVNDPPMCPAASDEPEPSACTAVDIEEQLQSYADLAAASFAPTPPPPKQPIAFNNADRTATRSPGEAAYASAGVDDEHLIAFAGAAAVKSHDAATYMDAEMLSASVQVGMQTEAQAGLLRLGGASESGRLTLGATVMAAELHEGIYNPDGSIGYNVGASATAGGAEATYKGSDWSGTLGYAVGGGAEASIGTQDRDGDGELEYCARVGFPGGLLLGGCMEKPW